MTVTLDGGDGRRGGLTAGLLAWLWPAPQHHRETRAGWAFGSTALGWLWPSAVHDEPYGHRHGLVATLFGWAWPGALDRGVRRWWHASWLWSWMWPGHVLGPDGEICALAPWHPAMRPEVAAGESWHHKLRRHGPVMFMMFSATAIAAPTFMDSNNGALDGGRVNLFRTDGSTPQDPPAGGDEGSTVEPGDGPGGGDGDLTTLQTGDLSGGGDAPGPQGPSGPNPNLTPNTGSDGGSDLGGGDGGGDTAPTGETPTGDGGTTVVDPDFDPSGDLDPPDGVDPDQSFGVGGGGGGGGGAGGGGGGGGTGGGGDPTGPGDPFTPPGPPGPNFDPPGPLPPVEPVLPGPPTGGGGGGPTTNPFDEGDPPGGGGGGGGGGGDEGPGGPPRLQEPTAGVPEPAAWAMMILGFGAVGYAIRRRRFAASFSQ